MSVNVVNKSTGTLTRVSNDSAGYEAITNAALDLPENTGKNILPLSLTEIKRCNSNGTWNDNVYSYNGVTFTINLDSDSNIVSVKTTGTASGSNADLIIADKNTPNIRNIMNGKRVILSGCPSNGSSLTYSIIGWHATSSESNARDRGESITFDAINMNSSFNFAISIANGYTIPSGGLLFYPMVRDASITDSTFAPYIPSVETRLEDVEEDTKLNTQDLTTTSRTKNIAPMTLDNLKYYNSAGTWTDNVYVYEGITYTVNTDNDGNISSIGVDGTASGTYSHLTVRLNIKAGSYKMNGAPTGDDYYLQLYKSGTVDKKCKGSDTDVVLASDVRNAVFRIIVMGGKTANNVTFYPMLRLATASATYEPYIPSVESRLTAVESGLANVGTYSNTEVAVGTYLGHVLYRREFDIPALPDSNVYYTPTNLGNVAIVDMSGTATNGTVYIPLPFIAIGSNVATLSINMYFNENREIVIATGSDRSGFSAKVVLYYYYNT